MSFLSAALGLLGIVLSVSIVHAASLTWTNTTAITLSAPAVNLTIASGSVADSFVVNATSVVVSLSSSTGGTFTLTATSTDLSISASGGGGTDPTSCTSGTASTTISQSSGSASYTITPTGSPCSGSSGGSNNNSNSSLTVGVASAYGIPNYWITPTFTNATSSGTASARASTSISSLQATLAALESRLQSLTAEARQQGIAAQGSGAAATSSLIFTRDLSLWSQGRDVQALQEFLIRENSGPAARKLAAHGTTYTFGLLTLHALIECQRSVGLPATGYFGPITREKVAGLP